MSSQYIVQAGDCRTIIHGIPDNSIDSIVTDPPYALVSVVKRFGKAGSAPAQYGTDGAFARASKGFMGKTWDTGDVAHDPAFWAECLRVLKPGGFVLAFGGTRTYHRLAVAIEDAGFEIRDMVQWLYGSGFPKSQNVSKFIDKELGATGSFGGPKSEAHAGWIERGKMRGDDNEAGWQRPWMDDPEAVSNAARTYLPGSEQAKKFDGFGTALKPACEPICMGRKPLSEKTIAANVLRWGTGAINIDGCRVGFASAADENESKCKNQHGDHNNGTRNNAIFGEDNKPRPNYSAPGRWPANVITDGSDEVTSRLPTTGGTKARVGKRTGRATVVTDENYRMGEQDDVVLGHDDPGGSVARFFYSAKANKIERAGSNHPTVKPIALLRYLCRLITPPGGKILDPFAGSGTTGEAAILEGFRPIMIEQESEYVDDIIRRMNGLENAA
jgi:DNA modification methylase